MKTKNAVTIQDIEQLSALLDGDLSPANAAAMRQRMLADEALQDTFSELALTQDAMRTMPTLKPPRSLRIDPQRLHQARGWRWWLISPPAGQLFPTLGVAMSLCFCLLFGAVAMQPVETHLLKGAAVTSPSTQAASADSVLLIASDTTPLAGSPWAWLGVVAGAGVLGGTARWSWQIRGRKRTSKR